MEILKCKMCGGQLDFEKGDFIATCQYCGSKQTLPQNDALIEKLSEIIQLRQNNDYDAALQLCEQNITTNMRDAESYWNMVLCRYGIEYVEDPKSHKHIPTINRMQFESILKDKDYLTVLELADEQQKPIYIEQAEEIYNIQKGTLDIIKKEKPFDVFICYKETDENGERTQESVIANDLYQQLTKEGFKVFFARITLEDKLGFAYEPYIFAALNSAKVMIVLGTKPEHFNAVWVKNEWSRFLELAKDNDRKMLVPAYRDMDPYDLPKEFAHLQAQDMSKLGFMLDLVSGIKKILKAANQKDRKKNILKWVCVATSIFIIGVITAVSLLTLPPDDATDINESLSSDSEDEPLIISCIGGCHYKYFSGKCLHCDSKMDIAPITISSTNLNKSNTVEIPNSGTYLCKIEINFSLKDEYASINDFDLAKELEEYSYIDNTGPGIERYNSFGVNDGYGIALPKITLTDNKLKFEYTDEYYTDNEGVFNFQLGSTFENVYLKYFDIEYTVVLS